MIVEIRCDVYLAPMRIQDEKYLLVGQIHGLSMIVQKTKTHHIVRYKQSNKTSKIALHVFAKGITAQI